MKVVPLYDGRLLHVHGPAGIRLARIHIQRKDEMFNLVLPPSGVVIASRKSAREVEIDNGRASDADGIEQCPLDRLPTPARQHCVAR